VPLRPLAAGDAVTIDYGPTSSTLDLLANYGMVMPGALPSEWLPPRGQMCYLLSF